MKGVSKCVLLITITMMALVWSADPANATRRALLIGIATYDNIKPPLENPLIDIQKVGEKLVSAEYVVTTIVDPDTNREKLITAIDKFVRTIKQNDEVLVYYSGHGVDIKGKNMLVPADSPGSQDVDSAFALDERLIAMRDIMVQIEDHQPAIQVWVIDACRDNPFASGGRPFAAHGGLHQFDDQRPNSFILFAAKYSQVARDSLRGESPHSGLGSPFSRTFVKDFDSWKDKDINLYAAQVRRDVMKLVKPDPQFPTFENNIVDSWCFVTCSTVDKQFDETVASVATDEGNGQPSKN